MMNGRLLIPAIALSYCLAAQAGAGIQYKGSVRTEGGAAEQAKQMGAEEREAMRKMGIDPSGALNLDFEVQAEEGKFKQTYLTAFGLFPKGTYVLGDTSGKKAYIVLPDKRQYIEMDLDKLQDMGRNVAGATRMAYSSQSCSVTPLPPKVVGGITCAGKRVELSYTVSVSIMGMNNVTRTVEVTDYYTTDKFDVLKLFGGFNWHQQGVATGDPAFDKAVAAKVGFLGFPVEVRTRRVVNGKDEGTTVLTTRDVQMAAILPGTFTLPSGYQKTEFGLGMLMGGEQGGALPNLEEILKQLGQGQEGR